jgi:acetyl/propionyl-CoA carboxylase alpha subunit
MMGKVIAYGDTRDQAIRRMRIALSEMSIEGIKTNIALHQELMNDAAGFIAGGTSSTISRTSWRGPTWFAPPIVRRSNWKSLASAKVGCS